MAIELQEQIRIDYIREQQLEEAGIRLGILRLDELHPLVSGNKWFKLKENIKAAKTAGAGTLLTFGGAYSNHLLATAAAAKAYGFSATGMVRGLHATAPLSGTLEECAALGMKLIFVDRATYNRKEDPEYLFSLQQQYADAYIIPEGGNNEAGIAGAAAIAGYLPADTTLTALAIGTGTTFTGIRKAMAETVSLLGFPVMKGGAYLEASIRIHLQPTQDHWFLEDRYHFGGFAKYTDDLLIFMNDFYHKHRIPLDFVYTGKMMYGIFEMIRKKEIPEGSHVICIHTGGLQGNRSIRHLLAYA